MAVFMNAQSGNKSLKKIENKYGALAIDRSNGFFYGWSNNYSTLEEARQRAIDECKEKGGDCTVVLSYQGMGCAVYRTINGNVGNAYGWGLAKTREEADAIALKECRKRSNGEEPSNFVWSCNDNNTTALKEIYNAINEIEVPVKVGLQTWSNRNLEVSKFRNGDLIPEAKNAAEWKEFCKTKTPAFCYLNFDVKNGKKYGKLYNFFAVIDPRGLAPLGWHVPSKEEYETLISFLGGNYEAGRKLRSISGWNIPEKKSQFCAGNGNNVSELNFLPGGKAWSNQYDSDSTLSTVFQDYYSDGEWWTSSFDGGSKYDSDGILNNGMALYFGKNNYTGVGSETPAKGFSVRLIKD